MSTRTPFERQYAAALRQGVESTGEAVLQHAYNLGRRALAERLGVLDVARSHHEALNRLLLRPQASDHPQATLRAASDFLLEALSSFEATQRGFLEANRELRRLNQQLERRSRALVSVNRRLQVEAAQRHKAEQQLLDVAGQEQQRIGQDLHDGLCQHLTGVALLSQTLRQRLAARGLPEADTAAEIATLIEQSIEQTRTLARGLYPIGLKEHGLNVALRELTRTTERYFNITCVLRCGRWDPPPSYPVALHLYRIAQEAITNAIKHGHAKRVTIHLRSTGQRVVMEVRDDGVGLDTRTRAGSGLGMHSMTGRANLLGGWLRVGPRARRGTVVTCCVPPGSPRS